PAPARGAPAGARRTRSPSAAARKPEHALGDDVAQDLRRPRLDRVAAGAELLELPVAVAPGELLVAEELERELRQALVRLRPDEFRRRAFGPGNARLQERRQGAVVGVLEPLQLDPVAGDEVA